ncbi:MAG: hypothetical protein IRY99_20805 [Isosphaeraceae bacterium]|nr:hypothetical protein [Isosphaeraceae bacterium]
MRLRMIEARGGRWILVLALLGLGAGHLLPVWGEAPRPKKELAEARIRVAKQALKTLQDRIPSGNISPDDPRFALWLRRIVETRRELGSDKAELIAAIQAYWEQTKKDEVAAERAYQNRESSLTRLLEARYHALQAESWLAEAMAK